MSDLITTELVRLGPPGLGTEKNDVIEALAGVVGEAGRTDDVPQLVADLRAREETSATGLPGGIAIPHCRTTAVTEPTLAFARLEPGVDFGAKDGPADLAFLIAAPEGGDADHLQLLTKLARSLAKPEFSESLRQAATAEEARGLILDAVGAGESSGSTGETGSGAGTTDADDADDGGAGAGAAATGDTGAVTDGARRRIVAVTACPTGIAHTYMAAEALEAAAERAGVDLSVETQGSAGATALTSDVVAGADAVIFAVDVGVRDQSRFAGKPLVSAGVKRAIDDPDAMVAEALRAADDPAAPRVEAGGEVGAETEHSGESWGQQIRRVLMTGVSYMIPFVAAGGLLIALGFLLGGYEIANTVSDGDTGIADDILATSTVLDPPDPSSYELEHLLFDSGVVAYLGALLFKLGGLAFSFLVPALAGYIAYAIADRPGIAPGFVMGSVALFIESGFLGGIVGGVLGGLVAAWIAGWRVPAWARGLMPVLVIPLLATLLSGLIMIVVLGQPLSNLQSALESGLNSLSGGSAIVLGAVLGLMMAFDMGGPLNKVAYGFATTGLGAAATATNAPELRIMAAVMLAGMVPPLALALATVVRPRLFTVPERENGKAAWLMGASFITEGAIPFAAADPLRVIPAIMAGSAVTGSVAQALDVSLRAPHGGIFVLFAVGNVIGFLIALAAGVLVATAAVMALKSIGSGSSESTTEQPAEPAHA